MKRTALLFASLAAVALLGACASPRNATIEDGKVTNITSAEAVTLVKQDTRRQKVADVQTNQKPILKLTAHAGKPIQIDAASLEVFVPQDLNVLMAEQADAVSENVQLFREVRGIGKDVVVPLGVAGLLVIDRKNANNNGARIEEARSAERTAQTSAMADLAAQGMDHASKPSTIVQVPLGSSVLGTTPE